MEEELPIICPVCEAEMEVTEELSDIRFIVACPICQMEILIRLVYETLKVISPSLMDDNLHFPFPDHRNKNGNGAT